MKRYNHRAAIRFGLAAVLILAVLLTACSTPNAGSATPAPQATTVNTPDTVSGATATVQPPEDQTPPGDYPYPGRPATPVITVTIEAYPTP
jgi:hypothetical protein